MMHWRAEPVADPIPARPRRAKPSEPLTGRPLMVRFLGLAVAALMTANGVVVAEQASGRDLMTLGRDGLSNAREAIAGLLEDDQPSVVAGEVIENLSTTTTAPAETTTTTAAPAAVVPPTDTTVPTAPSETTTTTAKKSPGKGNTDWAQDRKSVG